MIEKVDPKYRPVWEGRPLEEQIALARYFLPHRSAKKVIGPIDPLFPRSPLPTSSAQCLGDFGLPEAQTIEDLEALVCLAREVEVRHVVYSPVKIVQPRGRRLSETMQAVRRAYEAVASPQKLDFHGGSWRLPRQVARDRVVESFLDICRKHGVRAKYCKQNLIETP